MDEFWDLIPNIIRRLKIKESVMNDSDLTIVFNLSVSYLGVFVMFSTFLCTQKQFSLAGIISEEELT